MSGHRNFGLTNGLASGAQPQARSLHGANSTRADFPRSPSSFLEPPRSILESRQLGKPLLDERELSSCFLFCAVFIGAPLIVALIVLGYLKFIS